MVEETLHWSNTAWFFMFSIFLQIIGKSLAAETLFKDVV